MWILPSLPPSSWQGWRDPGWTDIGGSPVSGTLTGEAHARAGGDTGTSWSVSRAEIRSFQTWGLGSLQF